MTSLLTMMEGMNIPAGMASPVLRPMRSRYVRLKIPSDLVVYLQVLPRPTPHFQNSGFKTSEIWGVYISGRLRFRENKCLIVASGEEKKAVARSLYSPGTQGGTAVGD